MFMYQAYTLPHKQTNAHTHTPKEEPSQSSTLFLSFAYTQHLKCLRCNSLLKWNKICLKWFESIREIFSHRDTNDSNKFLLLCILNDFIFMSGNNFMTSAWVDIHLLQINFLVNCKIHRVDFFLLFSRLSTNYWCLLMKTTNYCKNCEFIDDISRGCRISNGMPLCESISIFHFRLIR